MALPDLLGALLVRTATLTATYTLCGGRVTAGTPRIRSVTDPTGWVMPTSAIVYSAVGGPSMTRPGRVPFRSQNVQVTCYGSDLRTAGLLYQTWYADFYPTVNNTSQGFIAAHCSISSLEELSSPIAIYDRDTQWPYMVSTHLIKYSEVPI